MNRRVLLMMLVPPLVFGPAVVAWAAETHSGTVTAIDPDRHTLTLQEMGPWKGPGTEPVTRSITLTSYTTVGVVARSETAPPSGWPGGYVESPASLEALHAGDFATVTVAHRDHRTVATSIDVVRPVE